MKYYISIFLFITASLSGFSQNDSLVISKDSSVEKDTSSVMFTHSAKKATWMSVAVPGLGQAYNKKYWKIPVIYGLLGTFGYLAHKYEQEYVFYRQAYKDRLNGDTTQDPDGSYSEILSNDELKAEMKRWERNRNFNYIGIFLTYIANIVDASVDANLYYYDISDDLSFRVDPVLINTSNTTATLGVKCKCSF